MEIKIQSVKFDADVKLIEFTKTKMSKLNRMAEGAISAEVIFRVDKDNEKGNKVATVKIEMPGGELFAESQHKSFEESVDVCIEAIKKQLDKYKEKRK